MTTWGHVYGLYAFLLWIVLCCVGCCCLCLPRPTAREGDSSSGGDYEHEHAHENGREYGAGYVRPTHSRGPSGGSSEGTSPLLPEGARSAGVHDRRAAGGGAADPEVGAAGSPHLL